MARGKSASFRPAVEAFEDRLVPAVTFYVTSGGDLAIHGSDSSDNVEVSRWNGKYYVVDSGNWRLASGVTAGGKVYFYGRNGNDRFVNNTYGSYALRAVGYGNAGNDEFQGAEKGDWFDGGAGNDTLYGYAGNDTLSGGTGSDHLDGYTGNDQLWAGLDSAYDYLAGWYGSDSYYQMSGSDYKYDPDDSSYSNYYSNSWYTYNWSYWNLW